MTCDDVRSTSRFPSRARVTGGRRHAMSLLEHSPNLAEPSAWPKRIRDAGRFVRADVSVIGCIRFWLRTATSWRTMDREAGTKGTAAPGFSGAEKCGGVMVRGPKSGNGTQSSVHYLDSAGLAWPRAQRLTLDSEMDPLAAGVQADGSLAARPGVGGSWRGAGGRWLLWPLRVVLWTALLVIAFRGITAIIFNSSAAPVGGTGAGAIGGGLSLFPGPAAPPPVRPGLLRVCPPRPAPRRGTAPAARAPRPLP